MTDIKYTEYFGWFFKADVLSREQLWGILSQGIFIQAFAAAGFTCVPESAVENYGSENEVWDQTILILGKNVQVRGVVALSETTTLWQVIPVLPLPQGLALQEYVLLAQSVRDLLLTTAY